jgi:hypothetical protein
MYGTCTFKIGKSLQIIFLAYWRSLERAGFGSGSVSQTYGSEDPDPDKNITDPTLVFDLKSGCQDLILHYQRRAESTKPNKYYYFVLLYYSNFELHNDDASLT